MDPLWQLSAVEEEVVYCFDSAFITVRAVRWFWMFDLVEAFIQAYVSSMKLHDYGSLFVW